ncbi:MAG: ParA family protein [Pseudomonadota bacterium]
MAIITAANSKGGSGKSTLIIILASALAESGATVSVIDADPQLTIGKWARECENLKFKVRHDVDENSIRKVIDEEAQSSQFVLVDIQGRQSRLMSRVLMACDLALVPLAASEFDADPGADTVAIIAECEQDSNRRIPYRIVFNRTNPAIVTTSEREIMNEIREGGLPLMKTHLYDRQAYRLIARRKCSVFDLDADKVSNVEKATGNAMDLATEVVEVLRAEREASGQDVERKVGADA